MMKSQITRSAAWELLRKYKGGPPMMITSGRVPGLVLPPGAEILCSYDTYQFSNYDRYDAATFSEAHKAEVRDTQFPIDLEKAYELGKRLVGKCD